jgi:putative FmdB family regulatory protein
MPTYDYKCSACNAVKPVTASFDEEVIAPKCDSCLLVMARDWCAPGIIFKGTGWGGKP